MDIKNISSDVGFKPYLQAAPQTPAKEEKIVPRAGEMAALPEDLSWVTATISENSQPPVIPNPEEMIPTLASVSTCTVCVHTHIKYDII